MNDASPSEPRFDEPAQQITRQIQPGDWDRAEIEALPAPSPRRERLFSRKVMIGWALFAIAAYFGVQVAKSVVKASFAEAVRSGTISSATQTKDRVVIETPNGTRISIGRDPRGPGVTVTRTTTGGPVPPLAPTKAAPGAATAPAAPPTIPPEPKKR
jgi:hypothetical protein